jgi:hypothetical protein
MITKLKRKTLAATPTKVAMYQKYWSNIVLVSILQSANNST